MFLKKSIVFIHVLLAASLVAQNTYDDLLNVSYQSLAPATFDSSGIEMEQQQLSISGAYGFDLRDGKDDLNLGAFYQRLNVSNAAEPNNALGINNFSLDAEYVRQWNNPSWASTISLGLGKSSVGVTDTFTAYQTQLVAMMHYGKRSDLVWTFGLLYSEQPFGPWLFPLIGVDWRATDRLFVSTVLFAELYVEYALQPNKLYVGLDISDAAQSFVIASYQNLQNTYITSYTDAFPYFPYNASLFLDVYLPSNITLFGKIGMQASRGYQHYLANHDRINNSVYDDSIDPTLLLEIGAAYRFRKWN